MRIYRHYRHGRNAVLHHGDCVDMLRQLPSNCVDLTITSPPYCMGKEYERTDRLNHFVEAHWKILPEVIRATKPGGSICWQVGYHSKNGIVTPLDFVICDMMKRWPEIILRNRIVWTFGHGMHGTKRFSGRHEVILWFKQFNSIGIIEGQHRVFAYHEGYDELEKQIAPKRAKQQLLVTGVVYPPEVKEETQHEFEARLFLEINDKQTKTKADLRQAIESIVNPFSVVAISRSIITKLAAKEPLCGYLEEHQFDRGKLKSSSIVSYGLRHIIKSDGDDTLFNLWKNDHKDTLATAIKAASSGKKKFAKPPKTVLDDYVQFCAKEINHILIGYKLAIPADHWTIDRKKSRAISTTAINGVIFCLRILLKEKKTKSLEEYQKLFKKLSIDFTPKKFTYKSSHWKSLGEKIFEQCFT
jgi:DNA methylase